MKRVPRIARASRKIAAGRVACSAGPRLQATRGGHREHQGGPAALAGLYSRGVHLQSLEVRRHGTAARCASLKTGAHETDPAAMKVIVRKKGGAVQEVPLMNR